MKRLLIFILIFLVIFPMISGLCEENQIDINGASLEELDNLYGIGPSKAEEIINSRPFDSVDELINVKGIGEKTLEKIKNQKLACVCEEEEEKEIIKEEEKQELNEKELDLIEKETNKSKNIELDVIKLNTKNIKTGNNNKNLDKTDYAKYGFAIFCALLGFLFILKKRKYKTEFN